MRDKIQIHWVSGEGERLICDGRLVVHARAYLDRHVDSVETRRAVEESVKTSIMRHVFAPVNDRRGDLHEMMSLITRALHPAYVPYDLTPSGLFKPVYEILKAAE